MAVGQALGCTDEVDHLPIGAIVAGLLQRTSLRMASLELRQPSLHGMVIASAKY